MLPGEFRERKKNENTYEFVGGGSDDGIYGGEQCACAAGGTSGKCAAQWSGSGTAGPDAGGESR
jgi:hypothetical protein